MYDVVIVGGSFAGLAVAQQLRGHRVLVIDQHPIGSHQSSTCGVPRRLARMVGADSAILETHEAVVMHAGGRAVRFDLPEPFVTFDYEVFCQSMLRQSDAEVRVTRALGRDECGVVTTDGHAAARFVVFATGWRSHQIGLPETSGDLEFAGRGIETELPTRLDVGSGLHFHFERRIVERGYAWVFPCGDRVRIGLVSSAQGMALRRRLDEWVGEFGLKVGPTHGGVIPVKRRSPISGTDFVVGDAAGQCLPITAEGIRSAITHGVACGRFIGAALRNEISEADAREHYRRFVHRTDRFHGNLLHFMRFVDRAPERLLGMFGQVAEATGIADFALRRYFAGSGWRLAD